VDRDGHASGSVELVVADDRLVLRQGFDVVIHRHDVLAVRVRWPRPWEALPLAPLLSIRTRATPDRWRRLFWGPALRGPAALRAPLVAHGWPVDGLT
jgi:hypothetical protein